MVCQKIRVLWYVRLCDGLVVPDILKAVWSVDVSGTTVPVREHHISENICSRYSIIISHSVHNMEYFLQELREEFDKFGWLLTAPLGVMPGTIERSYNIPAVSKYLDYMFALCYAYHGHWDSQTGPNAPLYPRFADDVLNVVCIRQICCGLVLSKLLSCVSLLPIYSLMTHIGVTGCLVQFVNEAAYVSANYGHSCTALLGIFWGVLLNFL